MASVHHCLVTLKVCMVYASLLQTETFSIIVIYRRSGNFRVKNTSPFNFSRCFIFVARAHQRKLHHAKILFTRTRARSRSRDWIPCCAIGEKMEPRISASEECSRHPYRITGREGTAIGYLPRKISPVCLGPRFQLPSEVRFRDRALGLV